MGESKQLLDFRSQSSKKKWWEPGLILFAEITAWLAGPVIIAVYLGRWLDEKFGKEPWFYFLCTAIAFVVTMVAVFKRGKKAMDDLEKKDER